jgi:hypothetical protein
LITWASRSSICFWLIEIPSLSASCAYSDFWTRNWTAWVWSCLYSGVARNGAAPAAAARSRQREKRGKCYWKENESNLLHGKSAEASGCFTLPGATPV